MLAYFGDAYRIHLSNVVYDRVKCNGNKPMRVLLSPHQSYYVAMPHRSKGRWAVDPNEYHKSSSMTITWDELPGWVGDLGPS